MIHLEGSGPTPLVLPHPCLIVTIGMSGSGKTTWVLRQGCPGRIGLDRLRGVVGQDEADQGVTRRALWLQTTLLGLRACARRSSTVDDTNTISAHRRRLTRWAARWHLATVAVPFLVPFAEAANRNERRSRQLLPSGWSPRVPEEVLRQQHSELAALTTSDLTEEGFTHLWSPNPSSEKEPL